LIFYGEFVSALRCVAGRSPIQAPADNWNDYLRRYVDLSHAPMSHESVENIYANPDLIENIYIWDSSDSRLLRLNADTAKIEISSIPPRFTASTCSSASKNRQLFPLLCALGNSRTHQAEKTLQRPRWGFASSASQRTDKSSGWQFDKNIPAIVHPIVDRDPRSLWPDTQPCKRPKSSRLGRKLSLILITFREGCSPDLTKRYFSGPEGLEYKLTVIATEKTPTGDLLF